MSSSSPRSWTSGSTPDLLPDMARTPDEALDAHLRAGLSALSASVVPPATTGADSSGASWWWELYRAQLRSRELDLAARRLQRQGRGFYTISSAGHEANALVALALRP